MDLCVLPQTGSTEPWLLLAIAAVVLVAAGVALAVSGRARRGVLTGLGALAIVGALVVGGVAGAAPAQADAGSADCVTAPARPAPAAAAIVVTPGIPTTTAQCAAEPSLQVPTTQGVVYSQARTGNSVTVTATAAPGYAILAGAVTSWTYDLTPTTRAPWPVDLPDSTEATIVLEESGEELVLEPSDPALVPSLQEAADAGALTYSLDGEGFAQVVPVAVLDEDGQQLGTGEVAIPQPSDISYDFERNVYLLSPQDTEPDPDVIEAQIEALLAQYPGAVTVQPLGGFPFFFELTGLRILASYEPGPGCATESAEVAIDVQFPFFPPVALSSALQGLSGVDLGTTDESPSLQQAPASEAPASEAPAEQTPEPGQQADGVPSSEAPSEAPVVEETPAVVEP
ncbi:LPXTG cell wall anchor domain-containing protein [Agrococcus sp. SGAir0287]|uniref:LPXTG cell wall anchor domain-containing protein n=1 Tax=Agrococcus sp. SGAir0287 TaxID=2070347 RepID=UPI0010CCCD6B|nr:LPXTG cell wall anchor domain-containing protein [Agrococcus sp. SGAir0287]QCR20392.1 hypothetical protein C1N71_13850 [Agrococcus sp. SGAir0287]